MFPVAQTAGFLRERSRDGSDVFMALRHPQERQGSTNFPFRFLTLSLSLSLY